MNSEKGFEKIKNLPWSRVFGALAVAAGAFLLISLVLEKGGLKPSLRGEVENIVSPKKMTITEEAGSSGITNRYPRVQPTTPTRSFYLGPIAVLIKPLLYIVLFLFIYLVFFKPDREKTGITSIMFFISLTAVLLIFVFSSADLLRMVLNYYLQKTPYPKGSYLFQSFAEQLARRMAALLLSLPLFSFLNFKICQKGTEAKGFFLALASLTGVFSLILAYFLLYGLFLWGLGIKGISLRDYTFPLTYFSIFFPLTLFYLVQYRKR